MYCSIDNSIIIMYQKKYMATNKLSIINCFMGDWYGKNIKQI